MKNELQTSGKDWAPISTAPKDGSYIRIYWFATKKFYICCWYGDKWVNAYSEEDIPATIKKMVWQPIEHLKYEDYQHLFI